MTRNASIGPRPTLRFGDFTLDCEARELRRAGERIDLGHRAAAVLTHLCLCRDRSVSKEELLATVWGDASVSEASIFTAIRSIRRALGDTGAGPSFIETRRGRGYRFVAAVEAVPAPDAPASDFVGRARVLERLGRAWSDTQDGRGAIVLLGGEPGIGKTRVVSEFAKGLPRVWRARCWEGDGPPPFWPWIQIVRAIHRSSGRSAVVDEIERGPLAAWLDDPRAGPAAATGHDPPDARFRRFEVLRRVLAHAAASAPTVVWLEDLHWADPSSLRALEYVAHDAGDHRWLIVGTYRDSEAVPRATLSEVVGRIARQPAAAIEPLAGLDEDDVGLLVERLTGARPTRAVRRALCARTGGNPLWIRALHGLGGPRGGDEAGSPAVVDGAGVDEVLEGLAARLSEQAHHVLECASVLGREAERGELVRLAELDEARVDAALDDAVRAGFVVRDEGGGVRFTHAVIRELFHDRLPVARAAELHGRAARLVSMAGDFESATHASRVARHHRWTASFGGASNVVAASRRAAEHALDFAAFDEAADHFAAARDALDHLGGDVALERCDLLLAEASALARGGRLDESIERSRAAVKMARAQGDGRRLARAAIGAVGRLLPMGVLDAGDVELLETALRHVDDEALSLRAELLVRLAAHAHAAGDAELGDLRMVEALHVAEQSGDPAALALALRARAYDRAGGLDPGARMRAAEEALQSAESSGDSDAAAMALFLKITASLLVGDVKTADRDADALAAMVDRLRLLQIEPFLLGYRTTRALMRGRYAEAEVLALRTAAIGRRVNSPVATMYFGVPQLGELRRVQGRAGEIAAGLAAIPDAFPDQPGFIGPVVLMLYEAGEHDAARRLFERAEAYGLDRIARDANFLAVTAMFVEYAFLADARRSAPLLYEMLAPHAHRFAAAGHAQAFMGPVSLSLALLSSLVDADDRADGLFADAVSASDGLGAPPLSARARLYWARALVRRGRGEAAKIEALLDEAIALAEPIGMTALLEAAAALRGRA